MKPGHTLSTCTCSTVNQYISRILLIPRAPCVRVSMREQIEDLMGINKDDDEESVMEATLGKASMEMKMRVHQRDQQLKVGLPTSGKTIE